MRGDPLLLLAIPQPSEKLFPVFRCLVKGKAKLLPLLEGPNKEH